MTRQQSFNPRSRGGSDITSIVNVSVILSFNPRSRGGSDACFFPLFAMRGCFNPRSRGGSDTFNGTLPANGGVSIHAPAGGAT